jgi:hypothetical protein
MKYLIAIVYIFVCFKVGHSYVLERKLLPISQEFVIDVLTVYNPDGRQTDSTPLITASNAKIDTVKLKQGKIKWLALSRDFLKRWGGKIQYGDTVQLITGDPEIDDHKWVVQDTMNKRYKKRGDLLFANRKFGRWTNVKMIKL